MQEINWHKLSRANRSMEVPFELKLNEQEAPILCEKVIRVLPGKRLVVAGVWDEKPIIAKIFFESGGKAKRHIKRELEGIEVLTHYRIPTPTVLAHGSAFKKRAQVIIFERIMNAKSLDEIWQQKAIPQELMPLMHAVTIELATHHVMGIVQEDLHLKNLLVKDNHIYTLDGGSITAIHEPLDKKNSLDNLALFFAQLGVGTEKLQDELFKVYGKARGWLIKPSEVQYLQNSVKNWNELRWQRYQKKLMRSCSAFGKILSPQVLTLYDRDYRTAEFAKMLANPEAVIQRADTKVLKAGNSSTVVEVMVGAKVFVIKRYNIKGFWHWLRRCFRPTRAANSWRLAHLLRMFGIPTAKPVAFIEKHFLGLRGKSYFVMEKIYGEDLNHFFADYDKKDPHDPHYVKVAVRVATLLKNLAKLLVSHGDLKATNILVHDERPVLIDLDGVVEHKTRGEMRRAYRREVRRFMRNWETRPRTMNLFEKLLEDE